MFETIREFLRRQRRKRISNDLRFLKGLPPTPGTVAVWGFLRSQIGLGTSARGLVTAIEAGGIDADRYAIPLRGRDVIDFPTKRRRRKAATNIVVMNPPELLAGERLFPKSLFSPNQIIGYWAWELPRLPAEWSRAGAVVDEVWTCSHFSAESIRRGIERPVRVIPHMIADWDRLPAGVARQRFGFIDATAFWFLAIFDFSSSLDRKNPFAVIDAFRIAFPRGDENVRLILKYHSADRLLHQHARLRDACGDDPRIIRISDVYSQEDLRALVDSIDCFVSLHRSEGFGLNIAESMLAGKPVIVTAYSGNMDFTSADNSVLIPFRPIPVAADAYPDHQGQSWADPDVAAAAEAMAALEADPALRRRFGRAARTTIKTRYNIDAIALVLQDALKERLPG